MKNERGITLVALIITVIVLLLLTGTAVSVGQTTHKTAQREAFISEMKIIQAKVDEEVSQKELVELLNMGTSIGIDKQAVLTSAYNLGEIMENDVTNCRYFSQADLESYFGLEKMEDDVVINFVTREVISMIGIEYSGTTYYTQYKLPGGQVIKQKTANPDRTINNLVIEKNMNGLNATITISNISITNATLSYREKTDGDLEEWSIITNYTISEKNEIMTISKPGIYEFKIVDNTDKTNDNCDEENLENYPYPTVEVKNTNSAKENEEISANRVDGVINSYDYGEYNWIEGTAILNGNQYIWVPRFAYRLNQDNTTYTLKYLKGTTNIATDNTYIDETFTIPAVFTKENETKLTGIWLMETAITSETMLINNIKDLTPQATNIITVE